MHLFKKIFFGLVLSMLGGYSLSFAQFEHTIDGGHYGNLGDMAHYRTTYINTGATEEIVNLSTILPNEVGYYNLVPFETTVVCPNPISGPITAQYNPTTRKLSTSFCKLGSGDMISLYYTVNITQPSYIQIVSTGSVARYDESYALLGILSDSVLLRPYAVIWVNKEFTGNLPQQYGDTVTFRLKLYNLGSIAASNLLLDDIMPAGFVLQSATLPGTPTYTVPTNTSTWTIPSIPAQFTWFTQPLEYTIVAKLNTTIPGAGLQIGSAVTNTAVLRKGTTSTPQAITFLDSMYMVDGDQFSTPSASYTGTTSFSIAGIPHVILEKTIAYPNASGHIYQSGDQVAFAIKLKNSTSTTYDGAVHGHLVDTLPSQFSNREYNISPTSVNGSVATWDNLTIDLGQELIVYVTGTLNANYAPNTIYTNNADFSFDGVNSGVLVDRGTVTGLILGMPDLYTTKTPLSPIPVLSGDAVSYRLTIGNTGNASFVGMWCLSDTYPSSLVFGTSSIAPSECNGQHSRSGTGGQLPFSVVVTGYLSQQAAILGTVIANTSVISYSGSVQQTNTTNDSATVSTVVGGIGRLNLSKMISTQTGLISHITMDGLSGTIVRYIINYSNSGTQTISGLTLTDIIPSGSSYLSGSPAPTLNGSTLTRSGIVVAPGSGGSLVLNTLITHSAATGGLINCVTGSASSSYLSGLIQNCATVSFSPLPDLSVTKSAFSSSQALSGSLVTFQIHIVNTGATAYGVVVQDTISSGMIILPGISTTNGLVASPWIQSGSTYNLVIDTVGTGGGTLTYTGMLVTQPTGSYQYTNTALLTGNFIELVTNNNSATVTGSLAAFTACGIQKSGQGIRSIQRGGVDLSGQLVTYTVTLTNPTTLPLSNIVLTDAWPAGVSRPLNLNTDNTINLDIDLLPGQSQTLTLTGRLLSRSVPSLLNTISAQYTLNGASFSCQASGNVITVQMGCNNGYLEEGEQCDAYYNNGIMNVITLSGSLFNSNSFSFDGGRTTMTCDACVLKATSAQNCVTMNVPSVGEKVSCATLTGGLTIPTLTMKKYVDNQDAQDVITAVTKSVGSLAQYTVVITNVSSQASAYNVNFNDVVPTGVTYVAGSISPSTLSYNSSTKTLQGNLGTIAPGASVTVSFNATVDTTASGPITNTAIVNYTDSAGNPRPQLSDPAVIQGGGSGVMMKKYVNNQDAQTISTAVASLPNSTVNYSIIITNTTVHPVIDLVFNDVVPSGVTYIEGSVSPSTVSYTSSTKTLYGNLGTLAPGASVTVRFDAKVVSTTGPVTNTAQLNYKDHNGIVQPPLADPAVITVASASCGNGTIEAGEECDLRYNNAVIGLYLDRNHTVHSDDDEEGLYCDDCDIVDRNLNRCGDGVLGKLEQCDLGERGTISDYLDKKGTVSAGQYKGGTCTEYCEIKGDAIINAMIPACWYTDTVISVMEDEILPVAWDIEFKQEDLVDSCSSSTNDGKILKSSLMCTFNIYNKNEEGMDGTSLFENIPCNTKEWDHNLKLFSAFEKDELFVKNPYGTFLADMDESVIAGGYGEYKISLDSVNYSYCDNGTVRKGSPYARVCQINIAVTRPYLMQKSNTVYKASDSLDDFFTLGDGYESLVKSTQFDKVSERVVLSDLSYKGKVESLAKSILDKYEKIAIAVNNNKFPNAKKVPGKSIYIVDGTDKNVVFDGNNFDVPTTLIVEGKNTTLTIKGSVGSNMLFLVPDGTVKFEVSGGNDDHRCGTQIMRGIIIAKEFAASDEGIWNTEDGIDKHPRCRKGNLHVYGALYGDNIDELVQSRRSHLEHWFTYKRNFDGSTPTESQVNAERRDEIYKGASVYIEQNPDLWRAMPPGAEDFLKFLNVSRN